MTMEIEMVSDSSVIFRNGSCTLRHRRSFSASVGGESTKCLAAPPCDKCRIHSKLFERAKSEHHSESKCADCGLLKKQKAKRKWRILYMTFVVAFITRTTTVEEVNESDNYCSVDDESRSGSEGDHIVDIIDTISNSIRNETNQTDQVRHDEIRCHQIITKALIKVTQSQVMFCCRLINMLSEICQASLSQENGSNKLKNTVYWKVNLGISLVCFLLSVAELIVEIKVRGDESNRRGYCCWSHNPGIQGQLFGNLFLYFGVVCSGIQVIINLITAVTKHKFVKFDLAPLFFSFFHLICYKVSLGKCAFHGCALECPECVQLFRGNEHDSDTSV